MTAKNTAPTEAVHDELRLYIASVGMDRVAGTALHCCPLELNFRGGRENVTERLVVKGAVGKRQWHFVGSQRRMYGQSFERLPNRALAAEGFEPRGWRGAGRGLTFTDVVPVDYENPAVSRFILLQDSGELPGYCQTRKTGATDKQVVVALYFQSRAIVIASAWSHFFKCNCRSAL